MVDQGKAYQWDMSIFVLTGYCEAYCKIGIFYHFGRGASADGGGVAADPVYRQSEHGALWCTRHLHIVCAARANSDELWGGFLFVGALL